MGSWSAFWLTYLLGGVTFLPLVVLVVLLHAHLTFPVRHDAASLRAGDADSIVQPRDDTAALESALEEAQKEESRQKLRAESDVAAGFFAVCREYTPMGINAKPIERSTPIGSTTVAAPSPSVYQTMYRTIFDRKQTPGPLDDNKSVSQRPKRAGNVFYVILRHGHLMLFDDEDQIEMRHVISLANHNVSIYSGGDRTPEGELFIKRNAICLARRVDEKEHAPDMQVSKPFYLFSENCSAKEDFYFALLRNQEQTFDTLHIAPKPQRFDVKNIISLVQKLHASEDHMQTRWLNAFIGRIFLGVHNTKDIENTIREKLTKKISRVKRPSILTRIAIQGIDTGDSAPHIMNPRLKDLNVEGEFVMEADLKYNGNFRLEVAATARIEVGNRFKKDVNLVLAVMLKKLEGHVYFKVKPPPSNRMWFCFQSMPKMEMSIEPIVSSRQITYTLILRQIENRIKEVVAETLVAPFWDDTPFFSTEHKKWRGGIFEGDDEVVHSPDHETIAAQLGNVEEVIQAEQATSTAPLDLPPIEKSYSMPVIENNQPTGFWARKLNKKSSETNTSQVSSASTTALDVKKPSGNSPDPPLPIRSGSFSTPSPVIGTEAAHAEMFKPATSPNHGDAVSTMASLSARSKKHSPIQMPLDSPSKSSFMNSTLNLSPSSDMIAEPVFDNDHTPKGASRRHTASSSESVTSLGPPPDSPGLSSRSSIKSGTASIGRGTLARKDNISTGLDSDTKSKTFAAVSNVAATAKRWGWNAIQRQAERNTANGRKLSDPPLDLNQPMGRGQPLPPPGTPLPRPGELATTPNKAKRKPVAPPSQLMPKSPSDHNEQRTERQHVRPPPLPRRRRVSEIHATENTEDNLLVVEAPDESEPNSPFESTASYIEPHVEDTEEVVTRKPESITDRIPTSVLTLPKRSELSNEEPPAIVSDANSAGLVDDPDDYSSWIDNPEFVETDTVGAKGEQTHH